MQLNLEKPLVFFDLETTGLNILRDRIVEISLLKIFPGGKEELLTYRVNPEIPIPEEAIQIHGITDDDVADKSPFRDLAPKVVEFLTDADIAGFNAIRFDVPFLAEELLRAGLEVDFRQLRIVDVQTIFHKMEKRTLQAAYKFYCQKELKDHHSAEADTLATYEVLKAQISRYAEIENNIDFLAEFSSNKTADLAGFISYKNNEEVFSFGKYKNVSVKKLLLENPGYIDWILRSDFPAYTKKVIEELRAKL